MKKNFKRAMAAVMAAALTLSLAGTAAEADAAKKKKIKLASKTVTVNVKKTKTVKIKNVKAKQVKKLTVKSASKKIATAKAKGKTAVKVTGKKADKSTKVKITLKLKGQKKATKLTLKVKVAKAKPVPPAVTNAPAPATQAPNVPSTKAPDAPAVSQPPQGGDASQAPATQKPSQPPKETKTPKPDWTPDPGKKVEDITLTYGNGEGYKFEAARMVNFSDADNYPAEGIDVRYYEKVTVNYKSDVAIEKGPEDWGGKATLSSTDEGLGCTAYTDGLYRRYLNDLPYEDGGYKVEYKISDVGEAGGLLDGYDFEEVGLIDCVSVQLESNTYPYVDSEDNTQKGVNFRLMSIEFKAPEKAPAASAPAASAPAASAPAASAPAASAPAASAPAASAPVASAPVASAPAASAPATAAPTAPVLSVAVGKIDLTVGEKTTVSIPDVAGVTVKSKNLTVSNEEVAELNEAQTELTALAKGTVKITGTVTVEYSGVEFTVNVESDDIIVSAVDELKAEVNVETAPIELLVDGTKTLTATGSATMNGEAVEGATFTYTWASNDTSVVEVADGVITAKGEGETTITVTAVAHKTGKEDSDPSRAVVIPVTVYAKLSVETDDIEYAETAVAINGKVAPKDLAEKAVVVTGGEIAAAEVRWALADTASAEFADIDAETGVVTGKKTGTVNVKATVKVTGPLDQDETVVVTGTVTVNRNKMLVLKNDSAGAIFGNLSKKPDVWEWTNQGIENEDGSMTFHTSAIYSGTGMYFYLNEDKSVFDASDYAKIKVTASSPSELGDKRKTVSHVVLDGNTEKLQKYVDLETKDKQISYEFNLTSLTSEELQKLSQVKVKFNAHNLPRAMTDEEQAAAKVAEDQRTEEQKQLVKGYEDLQRTYMTTFTIHSIELIAK